MGSRICDGAARVDWLDMQLDNKLGIVEASLPRLQSSSLHYERKSQQGCSHTPRHGGDGGAACGD